MIIFAWLEIGTWFLLVVMLVEADSGLGIQKKYLRVLKASANKIKTLKILIQTPQHLTYLWSIAKKK